MIKRKNRLKLFSVLVLTAVILVVLFRFSIVDLEEISKKGDDFQYNIITASSIIAGFLFTGISILISALGTERIKRLWDNHYLDNLYRSAFLGMVSDVAAFVIALALLCCKLPSENKEILYKTEIAALVVSLVFFIWCFHFLISVIVRLKENDGSL